MSHLFDLISLGGVEFANRIAVSPMCQYSAGEGSANDWHLQHLGGLSMSGAGLLIVEMTGVEPEARITRAAYRALFRRQRGGACSRRRNVSPMG